jgi:hypothetical protein
MTMDAKDIVARVREHHAAAVGIGHPDEEGYIAFLAAILHHIATLTAGVKAAQSIIEAKNAVEREHDDIIRIWNDSLIIAREQRDQWKMRAEKAEETVTLAVARADEFEREYLRVTREYMHLHAERDAPRVLPVVCAECKGIGYLTVHQPSANGGTVTTRRCSCNVSPFLINATAEFWSDTR